MKRTEIIVETQRVTVIQRHRASTCQSDPSLYDIAATEADDHTVCGIGEGQTEDISIPGEEKEPCTDSRNH